MSFDIRDLPLWADCPWRDRLPEVLEIRRGPVEGFSVTQVVVNTPGFAFHIAFDERPMSEESLRHISRSLMPRLTLTDGPVN